MARDTARDQVRSQARASKASGGAREGETGARDAQQAAVHVTARIEECTLRGEREREKACVCVCVCVGLKHCVINFMVSYTSRNALALLLLRGTNSTPW